MADFNTHIRTSCTLGVAYAAGGLAYGFPWVSSLIGGGLCGLAGMLPDLDSDSGTPFRETTAFVAAITPMLLIDRWQRLGFSVEEMVLAGSTVYLLIRFAVFKLLKLYTVHRGMFHSIPALIISGQAAFLLCTNYDMHLRYYKAIGMMLGFFSHLLLDELWSVDLRGMRIKKSFGTALKFWSDSTWANFSAYAKLLHLGYIMLKDPLFVMHWDKEGHFARFANDVHGDFQELSRGNWSWSWNDWFSQSRHDDNTPTHPTARTVQAMTPHQEDMGRSRGEKFLNRHRSLRPVRESEFTPN
jgi:hypothetical protein